MRSAATNSARARGGSRSPGSGKTTTSSGRSGWLARTSASSRASSASTGSNAPVTTVQARGAASGLRILVRVSISFREAEQQRRFLGDAGRIHPRHTPVIDGALAQQARAALGVLADHTRQFTGGAGGGVVGGAEYRHGGNAERGGNVHGAGIVGQKEAAGRGQIDELRQAGLAGKIPRLGSRPP